MILKNKRVKFDEKIIVNDCAQYFTALEEIKKGIKAQILDYDEDEEIDEGFAAEEITKLSDGVPVELWTANMIDYVYEKKHIGHMWQNIRKKVYARCNRRDRKEL